MENYFFLENYVTLEGAVFHNVLYYQDLPITRYQGFILWQQLFWVTTNSVHWL